MPISVYTSDLDNASYQYQADSSKPVRYLKVSNDLSAICVGQTGNGLKERLFKIASLGDNITRILSSSFEGFTKLSSVSTSTNVKFIEKKAFKDCTNLSYVDFLNSGWKGMLTYIDEYAFQNTKLRQVTLNFYGGAQSGSKDSYTWVGDYAFAHCSALQDVVFSTSPYMGAYMFHKCNNLTSVTINNRYSYLRNHVFSECTNLKTITIPQKFHMIPEGMFSKCSKLRNVTFVDGDGENASNVASIGERAFEYCTNLTSLTLPKSISAYNQINSNAFLYSNLKKITFKGFTKNQILFINPNTGNSSATDADFKLTISPGEWISKLSYDDSINIASQLYTAKKPFLLLYTRTNGQCGNCNSFKSKVREDSYFQEYVKEAGLYLFVTDCDGNSGIKTGMKNTFIKQQFRDQYNFTTNNDLPFLFLVHPNPEGGELTCTAATGDSNKNPATGEKWALGSVKATAFVDSFLKPKLEVESATQPTETTTITNPFLPGWGLTGDCEFVSGDGESTIFKGNDIVEYIQHPRIDLHTTSDFKVGTWYYNIKDLFEFADSHNLPVFIEESEAGCGPCTDFEYHVFNDKSFQQWVKSKNILLGCYNENAGLTVDRTWIDQTLQKTRSSDDGAGPPHLICRWKKSGGQIVHTDKKYCYNPAEQKPGDLTDVSSVSSYIETQFNNYRYLGGFNPPEITEVSNLMEISQPGDRVLTYSQMKMKRYEADGDDLSGKFFACYNLVPVTDENRSFSLSVVNSETLSFGEEAAIKLNQVLNEDSTTWPYCNPGDGNLYAYMYSTSPEYEPEHEGFIFTVGKTVTYSTATATGSYGSVDGTKYITTTQTITDAEDDDDYDTIVTHTLRSTITITGERKAYKIIQYKKNSTDVSYKVTWADGRFRVVSINTFDNSQMVL